MSKFSSYYKVFLVLAMSVITISACSGPNETNSQTQALPTNTSKIQTAYRTLTIDEFAEIIANDPEQYTIVNVHIPYEGKVAETDMQIPYNDVEALTSALPDKDAPIILYCRSGRMSEEASRALVDLGYTQIWDVSGGMNAWQASNRELLSDED